MFQEGIQQFIDLLLRYEEPIWVFCAVVVIFFLLKGFFIVRLERLSKKTTSKLDDMAVGIVKELRWPTVLVIAYITSSAFAADWSFVMPTWLRVILILILTYQAAKLSQIIFWYSKEKLSAGGAMIIDGFRSIITLVIYGIGVLVILMTLGYNVTSIIAGLGIGGIAIAFALQNILNDIFSSLSIYFDQPFAVGDFIVAGNHKGTVQRIGLKTTRLKSLDGELIIVANKDLTNSTIKNYHGVTRRRVVEHLGFHYKTTNVALEKLEEEIPGIINGVDGTEFSRMHFNSFGNSSLEHTLVYYIEAESYNHYVSIKNQVNLELKKHFEKKKISLAYPTQTVHVKR